MSIDQRLRAGLAANTDHVRPDVDHELAVLLRRARRRSTLRRTGYAGALAAAAAVAALLVPGLLDGRRSTEGPVHPPEPTPSRVLDDELYDAHVTPGTHVARFAGARGGMPRAVVDVPAGFRQYGDWQLYSGHGRQLRSLTFWTVRGVSSDPCHGDWLGVPKPFKDPGPTVADLAGALVRQPVTVATRPRPVAVAGHDGRYLEVTAPSQRTVRDCLGGMLVPWAPYPDWLHAPGRTVTVGGQTDRIWILDVAGQRLLVDAATGPGVDPAGQAELTRMVETLTFTNT